VTGGVLGNNAGGALLIEGLNSAFGGGHESPPPEAHLTDARTDDWNDESDQW